MQEGNRGNNTCYDTAEFPCVVRIPLLNDKRNVWKNLNVALVAQTIDLLSLIQNQI